VINYIFQKNLCRSTAITAQGDTNPSDATGVGYRTLKKCPLFHLSTYGNPRREELVSAQFLQE